MSQFFLLLVILVIAHSCQPTPTTLDSDDWETDAARIVALEQEIITASPLQQAEFELFNVNGFGQHSTSLPGASSWDYKVALKVDSSAIDQWTAGFRPVPSLAENLDWMDSITQQRKKQWLHNSSPEFFIRENMAVYMIVYRKEGLIFKSITAN